MRSIGANVTFMFSLNSTSLIVFTAAFFYTAEDTPPAKYSLDSDDLQASSKAGYVLSYKSYLSEAQKQRLMAFIKEIQPKITVFVAVMQKRNIEPPGPFLVSSLLICIGNSLLST